MKRVTLTFDNGPDPGCTPAVLDTLAAHEIRATFFVCGEGNPRNPALPAGQPEARRLLERAVAEGHWVGNHTLTHTVELGTTADEAVIDREIGGNEACLAGLNPHRLFRPYMGGGVFSERALSPAAVRYLCGGGYSLVLFNCVPRDWERPTAWPDAALEDMARRDWSVVVVHDVSRYGSMAALPAFIEGALDQGYRFEQAFPDDCVPIRDGRLIGDLTGLVAAERAG